MNFLNSISTDNCDGYNPPDPRSQHHREGDSLGRRGTGRGQGGCQCGRRRTLYQVRLSQLESIINSQSANLIFRAELLEKPIKEKRKSQWSWQFFERTVSLSDAVRERLLAGEPVDIVLTSKVCKIN